MTQETTLTGSIIKKLIAEGSKGEREAVLLVVGNKEYILRQNGGSPYKDPVLDELVGKKMKCDGRILGHCFIVTDWEESD